MSRIITPSQLRVMSLAELHALSRALASEAARSAAERAQIATAITLVRREIALRHLPRPGL